MAIMANFHADNVKEVFFVKKNISNREICNSITSYISFIKDHTFNPLSTIFDLISPLLWENDKPIILKIFQQIEKSPCLPWSNSRRAAAEVICAAFTMQKQGGINKKDIGNGLIALAAHYYSLGESNRQIIRQPLYAGDISISLRDLYAAQAIQRDQLLKELDQLRQRAIWNLMTLLDFRIYQQQPAKKPSALEAHLIDATLIPIFGLSYERFLQETHLMEEEMNVSMKNQRTEGMIEYMETYGWQGEAINFFDSIKNRIIAEIKK